MAWACFIKKEKASASGYNHLDFVETLDDTYNPADYPDYKAVWVSIDPASKAEIAAASVSGSLGEKAGYALDSTQYTAKQLAKINDTTTYTKLIAGGKSLPGIIKAK